MNYRQHCVIADIEDVDFREPKKTGDMSLREGVAWFAGFLTLVGLGVVVSL